MLLDRVRTVSATVVALALCLGAVAAHGAAKSQPDVSKQQRKLFSAFAHFKAVKPPKSVIQGMKGYRPPNGGTLEPRKARAVPDPRGGKRDPWYLVPGSGGVGLAFPGEKGWDVADGGGTASTNDQACYGRLRVAIPRTDKAQFLPSTPTSVIGAVTDDITSITATGGTGGPDGHAKDITVKPKNNVYFINAPQGLSLLQFNRGKTLYAYAGFFGQNYERKCDKGAGVNPKK